MDESFDETTHRVIEEHRAVKIQILDQLLADHCICTPKHTAAMVVRSIAVCDYAQGQDQVIAIDACLWMLDDIHATLFPDHEEKERMN